MPNFLLCRLRIAIQQCLHRHYEPWRAVTALSAAPVAIRFLDSRQRAMVCYALNRPNLSAASIFAGETHRQRRAAQRGNAIHEHGTGAAGRIVTTALGASKIELLP